MSGRDSVGELIPQDVADVFAQERNAKGSRRKKRRGSLGRAFSWLKGKKKKDINANGLSLDTHPGGIKAGKQASPKAHGHAVPKQDEEKAVGPPLFRENVFIEGSRPKYLEDLHSEAQQGLKLLQQEETDNGEDFKDDQSISLSSTVTVQRDEECSYSERSAVESDSTMPDAVSTRSTVSTRSSRSGLTRQASTFRPLNSGKKPEKAKARRRQRRTTVMGIPQHIQRELGLDRAAWVSRQLQQDEAQLHNGESAVSSADPPGGVGVQLQSLQTLDEDRAQRAFTLQGGHRDDLALLGHRAGPQLSALRRPKSLAVPWLTTASLAQHPPSPVMSISPQATYLSKIIPNAVLPPSIDVVEISRGRCRNSVRTVSKTSLLLASPASSRASTLSSASRHRPPPACSDSSGWSRSESSETLVSDSSTISSNGTPGEGRSRQGDEGEGPGSKEAAPDRAGAKPSVGKAPKTAVSANGKAQSRAEEGSFVRSLSVVKAKRAPAPPSRSYSLHKDKMKRRSRDLAELRVAVAAAAESAPQWSLGQGGAGVSEEEDPGSSPVMTSRKTDSPCGYAADTSSLEDSSGCVSASPRQATAGGEVVEAEPTPAPAAGSSPAQPLEENGLKKTVSPSSGYSSQGGTPVVPAKHARGASPKHKRGFLDKLQSIFSGAPHAAPTPSPLARPETPEPVRPEPQPSPSVESVTPTPSVMALRRLFDIPPPPKISAPPPPPPEVWAHSKRTFELLLGPPAPTDIQAALRKNPKDRRGQRQSPPGSKEGSVKSFSLEKKGDAEQETVALLERVSDPKEENLPEGQEKQNTSSAKLSIGSTEGSSPVVREEENERLTQMESIDMRANGEVVQEVGQEKVKRGQLVNGVLVKVSDERLLTAQKEERKSGIQTSSQAMEAKTDSQPKMGALALAFSSPSPSPPPAHLPPLPPAKQTPPLSPSVPAPEPPTSPDSFWPPPPPPPPIDPPTEAPLSGHDDMDFPPPPLPVSPGQEGVATKAPAPPVEESPSGTFPTTVLSEQPDTEEQTLKPAPTTAPAIIPVKVAVLPTVAIVAQFQGIPPPPQYKPPPPPETAPPPAPQKVPAPPPPDIAPPPEMKLSPPQGIPPPPTAPPQIVPTPPPQETADHSAQDVPPSSESVAPPPERIFSPPESIPPPPPPPPPNLPPAQETADHSAQDVPPSSESVAPPPERIFSPPESIPSPPPPPPPNLPPAQETATHSSQDVTPSTPLSTAPPPESASHPPKSTLSPPQSIPPPPSQNIPVPPPQMTSTPQEDLRPLAQEAPPVPPPTIPPPPPQLETPAPSQEATAPAPSPAAAPPVNIPPAPPVPEPAPVHLPRQPDPKTAKSQTQDRQSQVKSSPPAPAPEEAPPPVVTPSILQTVKLRSVNSGPDQTKTKTQDEKEAPSATTQPSNGAPTPDAGSQEAPQKPIRRSLILTTPPPTDTAPPAIITSQPPAVTTESTGPVVTSPPASTAVTSPTRKSPAVTATNPSMRLQEAIRLRTAARTSKDGPPSRLGVHSPSSPPGGDVRKSPSNTASFIFSKSSKKVLIDTSSSSSSSSSPVAQTNSRKNLATELPSANTTTDAQKAGVKVPPPVAKKPKAKVKETDDGLETVQAAGQQAQPDKTEGTPEAPNGTTGSEDASPS